MGVLKRSVVALVLATAACHQADAVQHEIGRLRDPSPAVRADAALALGAARARAAVGPLADVLKNDRDHYVRWAAANSLGDIGDPAAVPALVAAIVQPLPPPDVLGGAIDALGEIRDPAATRALVRLMHDDGGFDLKFQGALIAQGQTAVAGICGALDGGTTTFRERLLFVQALGKIGGPEARRELAKLAVKADPETRQAAQAALASAGSR